MTSKEILIKAIKKAEHNKFSLKDNINGISETLTESIMDVEKLDFVEAFCLYMNEDKYIQLIFSHDFAKAFWGKGYAVCNICKGIYDEKALKKFDKLNDQVGCMYKRKNNYHLLNPKGMKYNRDWTYHLQQMVISKQPLKYLEKFL